MQSHKKIGTILKQHPWLSGLAMLAVLIVSVYPVVAHAAWPVFEIAGTAFIDLIVTIATVILNLLGFVINKVIYILLIVATYDNFATSPAVANGWVIMRDLANMAIVVALLYIAFANALGKGKYSLDQALMRLVGVAIVVNFSKTLTLMLVDVSQVVMMTFVNAFKDVGVGNFAQMLGVEKFGALSDTTGGSAVLGGVIFNIVIMLIVIAVLVVMIGILVVRIVSIWLFIVIAPIAFMGIGSSVPFADKIWGQWWSKFQEYLLIGPCIAFFIWLTFTTLQSANTSPAGGLADTAKLQAAEDVTTAPDLGKIGRIDTLAGFVVSIAMLLLGVGLCAKMASGVPGVGGLKPSALKKGIMTGLSVTRDIVAGTGRRVSSLGGVIAGGPEAKGIRGFIGNKVVGGAGTVLGKGVAASKFVEEFVKEPGGIAKAAYRRGVLGEKGAMGSAVTKGRETEMANASKKFEGMNMNQSELRTVMDDIKAGKRKDLTIPEQAALFKIADQKGALKTEDEFNEARLALGKKALGSNVPGMASFYADFEKDVVKKRFGENSINTGTYVRANKKAKGGYEIDTEYALSNTFEYADESNEFNLPQRIKHKEIDVTSGLKKHEEDGVDAKGNKYLKGDVKEGETFDTTNVSFQNKKTAILGINELSMARLRGAKVFKDNIRERAQQLLRYSVDPKTGKSSLTQLEVDKVQRLIASTLVDSGDMKNKKDSEVSEAVGTQNIGKAQEDLDKVLKAGTRDPGPLPDGDRSLMNKTHRLLQESMDLTDEDMMKQKEVTREEAVQRVDFVRDVESKTDEELEWDMDAKNIEFDPKDVEDIRRKKKFRDAKITIHLNAKKLAGPGKNPTPDQVKQAVKDFVATLPTISNEDKKFAEDVGKPKVAIEIAKDATKAEEVQNIKIDVQTNVGSIAGAIDPADSKQLDIVTGVLDTLKEDISRQAAGLGTKPNEVNKLSDVQLTIDKAIVDIDKVKADAALDPKTKADQIKTRISELQRIIGTL